MISEPMPVCIYIFMSDIESVPEGEGPGQHEQLLIFPSQVQKGWSVAQLKAINETGGIDEETLKPAVKRQKRASQSEGFE
mmetsp:Transcript_2424/g.5511  ORF Transcript_2424/g.5511 Transcript_2424/m.5511 type:complete len:80 (-) Transcript_2424:46-285(-)